MAAAEWMQSPGWLTAGWIMLHFLWVGAAIGLLAALGRLLLQRSGPGVRYCWALACLAAIALAPAGIAICLESRSLNALSTDTSISIVETTLSSPPRNAATASLPQVIPPQTALSPWEVAAAYLPWLWLIGAPLFLAMIASGLVGTQRLRRQSEILNEGEVALLCKRLVASLGLGRKVAVGICQRLTSPILVGIVRPMILLPPAALSGWSIAQLEMVLLHELAHVRRWDSLVNLLQRTAEALLFFHPVVWWLSAWVRLERELCCDAFVVCKTGRPQEYAETLAAFAFPATLQRSALAMAESNLVTRIRCILNLEDRSMKLSTKSLALVAALAIGSVIALHLYAQPAATQSGDGGPEKTARPADKKNEPAKGVLKEIPFAGEVVEKGQRIAEIGDKPKAGRDSLELRGHVIAAETVNLFARVAGTVDKVNADIGDRVKKGTILAQLAVPEIELELKQKKALRVQAEVEIDLVRRSIQAARAGFDSLKAQIRAAEGEVEVAKQKYSIAKAEADQAQEAFARQQLPKAGIEIALANVAASKAVQGVAQAKLEAAKANAQETEAKQARIETSMRVAEAKLEIAQVDLQATELRLQNASIRAPFDGVVMERTINVGAFVPAGADRSEPLFTIARTDPVRIVVRVPEQNINRLRKGASVTVVVDALPNQKLQGKLVRLAPAVEMTRGLNMIENFRGHLRVEIELPNPGGRLLPGLTAGVVIPLE